LKLSLFYICIFSLLLSCRKVEETDPVMLVRESIEAHGGLDEWNEIKGISYHKRIVMFLADGNVESDVTQKIVYRFKPKFSGEMQWKKDSTDYRIVFDGKTPQLLVDGAEVRDSVAVNKYFTEFMASYYVFAQPFKLLDDLANRTYEGETELENGEQADVVKVTYPTENKEKSDEWWYFFDKKTHRLAANMVHHKKGYSYIKNTRYRRVGSLLFNAERKSYNVDSLRNIQYLRADYFLTGFKIEM